MKIAIVGCGALGSFYGARLARGGQEAHFLLRSDFDSVSRHGLRIQSIAGDFHLHPRCSRRPEEIGISDLVIIALKTTANDQFERLLPPLVGPRTTVLTLQNGLGNEERLSRLFSPEQVMGGLCFVCVNRVAPGRIAHLAHGRVVVGEFAGPARERTREIAGLFQRSGVDCTVTDSLAQAHWAKLVWNVPFNGLGVAASAGYEAVLAGRVDAAREPDPCLATDRLLAEPRWEALVRELMAEVIQAGIALGHDLPASLLEHNLRLTREMGPYKPSTVLDFEAARPVELESLFREPRRQALSAGLESPRLGALVQVLEGLEAARQI